MTVSRREFLKGSAIAAGALAASGLGAAVLPGAANVAFAAQTGEKLEDFYDIDPVIPKFDEKNQMFSRGNWDPELAALAKTQAPNTMARIQKGETGWNFLNLAFRNGASAIVGASKSNTGEGTASPTYYPSGYYVDKPLVAKPPSTPVELTPERAASVVKKAARFYGADLVGITTLDERWVYSGYWCRPNLLNGPIKIGDFPTPGLQPDGTVGIDTSMKYVVIFAVREDLTTIRTGQGLMAVGATLNGYEKMAVTAYKLAEFIWGLGYKCISSGNGLAVSGPHAAAAGLGELGRNGLLVTPEFGPNIRLAKVVTSLPMALDKPRDFGIRKFCEVCKKCAKNCPSKSIPEGGMQKGTVCMSNQPGVLKWVVNVETCWKYWQELGQPCSQCQSTCPYTKDTSYWTHSLGAKLAPVAGSAFVKLDDLLGYGTQTGSDSFWDEDGQ